MSCERIRDKFEDALDVTAHLEACKECRDAFEAQRLIDLELRARPQVEPSRDLTDRVMDAVKTPPRIVRMELFRMAVAAAALLVIVVGFFLYIDTTRVVSTVSRNAEHVREIPKTFMKLFEGK